MKNARAIGVLAVSVILGLVATAMAVSWVSQKGSVSANKIVVAAADIELGSRIAPPMLAMVDWPSGSVPQGAFKDIKELQDRVARTSIQRGEAILGAKLAPEGTKGGLSAVITDGKRAMTVRVNDVVGVAGFALPGNYVDVMVNTHRDKDGAKANEENQQISKTVLEHVLVLAVAQEAGRDDTKPKVVSAVTLELSPGDAEKLDLARNIGSLSLVLRNQVDKQPVATAGFTKKQLFGDAEPLFVKVADSRPTTAKTVQRVKVAQRAAPVPAASPANCVEVIHNNTRTLNCF
jgi:pilus assembly protein CpaB